MKRPTTAMTMMPMMAMATRMSRIIRHGLSPQHLLRFGARAYSDAPAPDRVGGPEIRRMEFVRPQIGHDLPQQAPYAALGGILLSIWSPR
jgi:hypothetical protein